VPFADPEIFYGPIAEHADGKLSVIPDFIANCGMARVFAYCMQYGAELTDKAIFDGRERSDRQGLGRGPWPQWYRAAAHAPPPLRSPYTNCTAEISGAQPRSIPNLNRSDAIPFVSPSARCRQQRGASRPTGGDGPPWW
jgi:hypothetical protein